MKQGLEQQIKGLKAKIARIVNAGGKVPEGKAIALGSLLGVQQKRYLRQLANKRRRGEL